MIIQDANNAALWIDVANYKRLRCAITDVGREKKAASTHRAIRPAGESPSFSATHSTTGRSESAGMAVANPLTPPRLVACVRSRRCGSMAARRKAFDNHAAIG